MSFKSTFGYVTVSLFYDDIAYSELKLSILSHCCKILGSILSEGPKMTSFYAKKKKKELMEKGHILAFLGGGHILLIEQV